MFVVLLALAVHALSLVVVGGDWMAFFRLMVPVLPGALLVAAELAERAPAVLTGARVVLALAPALAQLVLQAPAAARVGVERHELVRAAEPLLAHSRRIAALDVGWLGAATRATLVDLGGITAPDVARLPGGHGAKKVHSGLLSDVDTAVLFVAPQQPLGVPWHQTVFDKPVEQRTAHLLRERSVRSIETLPLGDHRFYVVVEFDR
jgi:hypothetical protein